MHEMSSDRSSRAENSTDLRKMSMRVFWFVNTQKTQTTNVKHTEMYLKTVRTNFFLRFLHRFDTTLSEITD